MLLIARSFSGSAVLLLVMVAAGGASAAQVAASPTKAPGNDRCATLAALKLDQATIESAVIQLANAPVTGAKLPNMTGRPGGGAEVAGLPAFCRVTGSIRPEPGSDIHFEVWLPSEGWDGRLNGAGNGGLAGQIPYNDLASAVKAGQVGAATDTGHSGNGYDSAWAKGHPERVRDYGWRAIHLTAMTAKKLTAGFYGRGPDRSYFIGCSNGGRAALMQASRFPEDYDGIIAGAPAGVITDLAMSMISVVQAQAPPGAAIRPEQIPLLQSEVLKQCDTIDSQKDGFVADPTICQVNTSRLACGTSNSPHCFTPPQIAALNKIHDGARDASGRRVAYGYPLTGAEVGVPVKFFGWDGTLVAGDKGPGVQAGIAEGLITDLAPSPIATSLTFDFNKHPAQLKAALAEDLDAKPDLRRFFDRGGKLILWHGWSDSVIPPQYTVDFHNAILHSSGARSKDSMRLFMVPGVQHCAGGPGPDAFGQIGAPPRGDTPERNIATAMQAWVETGRTPDSLVGRHGLVAMMAGPPAAREKQRLICAYPAQAVLKPGSDPDNASSYSCRTTTKSDK